MAYTVISSHQGGNLWPSDWGTSGTLGIFCTKDFVADDGKSFQQGNTDSLTNQFVTTATITIAANIPTYGSFTLPKTDIASPITVRYVGVIFDSSGVARDFLFSNFDLVSSLGNSITYLGWWNDNQQTRRYPVDTVPTTTQMNLAIAGAITAPSTTTRNGISKSSTAPTDSSNPIHIESTDPKVIADQAANVASIRTLGTGALQAAAGNDPRLTNAYYLNVTDYGAKVDGVTDDTAAWNAALTAAYVLKVSTIRMPGGISIVSSIVLPAYSSAGNEGISITIEGVGNPPVESGTFPGTLLATSKASIIKSTSAGTSGVITQAGAPFQNVNLTLRNIVIRREDNPTGPGLDASNGFGVYLDNVGIDTGRYTTSIVQPTHTTAVGIKLPGTGNAGSLIIRGNTSIQGFYTGLLAGEHLVQSGDLKIGGCAVAIEFPAGYLALNFQRINLFNCTTFFKYTGASYVLVQQMNIEHADSGSVGTPGWQDTVYDIDDATKVGRGIIGVNITKANIGVDSTFVRNGGNYIAVHQLMKLSAGVIRYSNNAAISIPNNVDTGLSFNTSDLEGEWIVHSIVGGISRFTVRQSGNYIAGGEFDFALNATGTRLVYAKLNATTVIGKSQQDGSAAYTRRIDLSTVPYFLEVGDYIEFYALQDSGGALNVLAVTGSSPVGFVQRVS